MKSMLAKWISLSMALLLTLGALAGCSQAAPSQESNAPQPDVTEAPQPDAPEANRPFTEGNQIGERCYDVTLPLFGGGNFTLSEGFGKGKLTVLNFWGVWCPPCRMELPEFNRIASEYADQISVVTVHTPFEMETTPDFIQANFPDSKMIFAYDPDNLYYEKVSQSNLSWPVTMILDENGIIKKRFFGTLTYEELQEELQKLLPAATNG